MLSLATLTNLIGFLVDSCNFTDPLIGTGSAAPVVPGIWATPASGRAASNRASAKLPISRVRGLKSVRCILSPRRQKRRAAIGGAHQHHAFDPPRAAGC